MPRKANVKLAKTRARAKQLQRYDEDERCAPATIFPFPVTTRDYSVSKSAVDPTLSSDPRPLCPPAHSQRHVHLGERVSTR